MLELIDVRRRFGDAIALDGLTFTVPAGQVFGFLGPNGAGKTTAMRAVFGVTALDPVGVDAMSDVLRERAAAGVTVLFSSHQLDLVEHLCEAVAIVHRGRLVAEGRVDELGRGTGRRLAVRVAGDPQARWAAALDGRVRAAELRADGAVALELAEGADPQAVLDAARAAGSLEAVLVGGREVLVKQRAAQGVSSDSETGARLLAQLAAAGNKLPAQPAALPIRALEPPPPSLTPRLTGMGVIVLIYLLIFVYGQRITQGVGDEKQSRVVEVLLATLRPTQLLTGKMIGIGLVAMAQVGAALAVFLLLGWAVGSDLVHGASGGVVAVGALWFVLGYAFYCTAFAAAGSLLSRSSDAANVSTPLAIPLIAAYGISFSVLFGHVSAFYRVLAFFPPTAPVAMPTVYAVGAASALDIAVSAAITVAATIGMTWLGGLVYQRAIMRTGERVRLRQVLGRAAA